MPEDPFVNNIQNYPKEQRAQLIESEIFDRWRSGGEADVSHLLEQICWKGKRWEQLITAILQKLLDQGGLVEELRVTAENFLNSLASLSLVIRERDSGMRSENLKHVLGGLERLRWHRNISPWLNVRFETQHAYVYGLCAVAAWAAKHQAHLTFDGSTERVSFFLKNAGVQDALDNPEADPIQFDTQTIFGFTRIDPNRHFDTDTHAGRLVRLFRENADLSESSAQSLSISFAELIENAVKHGEISSSAWLFANYHPQPRIMHVCICDCGIGVQESFRRSRNPRMREIGDTSQEWIRQATEPLVTSKSEGHAGYGLYLVRELCRRNGGNFVILSGNAAFRIRPANNSSSIADLESTSSLPYSWQGTFVAMQFHLNRPLELGPIYDTLPMPLSEQSESLNVDLFDE